MGKKREAIREYRFTDAKLERKGGEVIQLIERDADEMEDRGINEERKNRLIELRESFAKFPTDQYYLGHQSIATENKDNARARLITLLRSVFNAAENVFGYGSSQYLQLGSGNLTKLTDDNLVRNTRNTVVIATKYLDDLRSEGLTDTKIAELISLNKTFDESIDELLTAKRNRDIATKDRIDKGNALYNEIVKICNTGKDIWYEKNESKYNDYVLYNTSSGEREAPEEVSPA
jgi:hypothetical protein